MSQTMKDYAMLELAWENLQLRRAMRMEDPAYTEELYMDKHGELLTHGVAREVMLRKERWEQHLHVDEYEEPGLADYHRGKISKRFVAQIICDVRKTFEYKYPADWWQAFKERWFPDWAKKRWPVQYTTHKIDAFVLYPELDVQDPRLPHQIYWKVT